MQRIYLKVGDIIEIPLPNGKKAYGQYLGKDSWGDLLQIFDYVADQKSELDLPVLKTMNIKFGPILTRIRVGIKIREFNWKKIGNIKVTSFKRPHFIWKEGGPMAKSITTRWYLYDGIKSTEIGKKLPNEYKSLEYLTNYSPQSLVIRIATGENPDQELILGSVLFY